MQDIVVYTSVNDGNGGAIDERKVMIYSSLNFACLYVVNESSSPKRVLNISLKDPNNSLIGVVKEGEEIVLNSIQDQLKEGEEPSVVFLKGLEKINKVIPPRQFMTLWVKKGSSFSSNTVKKHVNIFVEWVDEY